MSKQDDSQAQQRTQTLHRYMNALERGELVTIAAIMGEAEHDPVLEAQLLKANRFYQSQEGIVMHGNELLKANRFLSILREKERIGTHSEELYSGNYSPTTATGKSEPLQEGGRQAWQTKAQPRSSNFTPPLYNAAPRHTARFPKAARLVQMAGAIVITAIILIGFLLIFSLRSGAPRQTSQNGGQAGTPPSLYIIKSASVYRIDARTQKVIWQKHIASQASDGGPQPVVIGNSVYIVAGNRVVALDANTGTMRWFQTFSETIGIPYIDDGLLYFTAGNSPFLPEHTTFYALNPATGKIAITYTSGQRYVQFSTVAHGVLYYIAGSDSSLHAIQLPGGKILWQQKLNIQAQTLDGIYVHNNIVYGSSMRYAQGTQDQAGFIYAFDAHTGKKLWQSPALPRAVRLVTVTDDMIYAAAFDELVAFDVHTRAQIWQQPLNTYNIVKDSDTLYITYSKGNDPHEGFAALDARTGKILWQKVNRAGGGADLAGIVNGVFYGFGVSNDGKEVTLYALFANNGAIFWTKAEGPFSQWGGMAAS